MGRCATLEGKLSPATGWPHRASTLFIWRNLRKMYQNARKCKQFEKTHEIQKSIEKYVETCKNMLK